MAGGQFDARFDPRRETLIGQAHLDDTTPLETAESIKKKWPQLPGSSMTDEKAQKIADSLNRQRAERKKIRAEEERKAA